MLRVGPLVALVAVTALARPAGAKPHTEAATTFDGPPARVPRPSWYGWQTLLADTSAIAMFIVAGNSDSDVGIVGGLAGGSVMLLLGPPTVHWLHGRTKTGFLSLSLRATLPLVGGGMIAMGYCPEGPECNASILLAMSLIVAPVFIDSIVLAWDPVPESRLRPSSKKAFELRPLAFPTKGGFVAGLGGTY